MLGALWKTFPHDCFLQNSSLLAAVRLLLGDRTADDVDEGQIQSGSSCVPVTLAQMAELWLWRVVTRLLLTFRRWCPLAWEGGELDVPVYCPRSTDTVWGQAPVSCSSEWAAAPCAQHFVAGRVHGFCCLESATESREEKDL